MKFLGILGNDDGGTEVLVFEVAAEERETDRQTQSLLLCVAV